MARWLRSRHETMRTAFTVLLAAAAALTLGGPAGAQTVQTLTFNEMALQTTEHSILGQVIYAAPGGVSFYSDHFLVVAEGTEGFASSGSLYIGYESGRGYPITMDRLGDGSFSLLSLDVGEFFSVHTP